MMNKKNNNSETKLLDSFQALNLIDEAVMVVDKAYSLYWKNETASAIPASGNKKTSSQKCYNILNKRSSPCKGCPVQKTLKSGNPATTEISSERSSRYYLVTSHPIPESDKILVTHKDITFLRKERNKLQRTIAALPYGVILLNTSFKIQYINMSFYLLFPFIKTLAVDKDLRLEFSAYIPPFPDKFKDFIFKSHQNPELEHHLLFSLTRGLTNSFEVKSLPVFDSEERKCMGNILIFADRTKEVIATEIKRREAENTTVKDILNNLSRTFSPRLKNIQELSHTLQQAKSPLKNDKSPAWQIIKETRVLQQGLEHLEKFYSPSTDAVKIKPIKLNQIVRDLIKNTPHAEVTIKLDLSRHVKPFYGDLGMIRALIRQLLESAMEDLARVQETPEASLSIIIKTRMRENMIELIFKDNGVGSEKGIAPLASTPPREAHREPGLHLCEKIAKIHGGSMAFQAVQNIGTKVTVRIPYTPSSPEKLPNPAAGYSRLKTKKTGTAPQKVFRDCQAWVIGEKDFHAGLILKFLDSMSIHYLFIQDTPALEKNLSSGLPSLILINASAKETFLRFLNILKQKEKTSLSRTLIIVPDPILPLMRGRVKDYRVLLMKKPFTLDLLMENISRLLSENSDRH